jgi:hypothetical protein
LAATYHRPYFHSRFHSLLRNPNIQPYTLTLFISTTIPAQADEVTHLQPSQISGRFYYISSRPAHIHPLLYPLYSPSLLQAAKQTSLSISNPAGSPGDSTTYIFSRLIYVYSLLRPLQVALIGASRFATRCQPSHLRYSEPVRINECSAPVSYFFLLLRPFALQFLHPSRGVMLTEASGKRFRSTLNSGLRDARHVDQR